MKLERAQMIIENALAYARQHEFKPIAVAVVDAGGHLVAFAREDGAGFGRLKIACDKVAGPLSLGWQSSRQVADAAHERPAFGSYLATAECVPSPGGIVIFDADRQVDGGVGVSGELPENDDSAARAGIEGANDL